MTLEIREKTTNNTFIEIELFESEKCFKIVPKLDLGIYNAISYQLSGLRREWFQKLVQFLINETPSLFIDLKQPFTSAKEQIIPAMEEIVNELTFLTIVED